MSEESRINFKVREKYLLKPGAAKKAGLADWPEKVLGRPFHTVGK